VAAKESEGEIIAPNKNPKANGNPGISRCEIMATALDVKMTNPSANKPTGLRNAQKSFQEVFQAAAYSKGGTKMVNTKWGSRIIENDFGINPMNRPLMTKKTG